MRDARFTTEGTEVHRGNSLCIEGKKHFSVILCVLCGLFKEQKSKFSTEPVIKRKHAILRPVLSLVSLSLCSQLCKIF